jgi:hypothetical protein
VLVIFCIQDDEEAVLEGEKEAEKMIVEAYSALLLAFLSTESRSIRNSIKDYLPKRNLAILVPVLERFVVCTSLTPYCCSVSVGNLKILKSDCVFCMFRHFT